MLCFESVLDVSYCNKKTWKGEDLYALDNIDSNSGSLGVRFRIWRSGRRTTDPLVIGCRVGRARNSAADGPAACVIACVAA